MNPKKIWGKGGEFRARMGKPRHGANRELDAAALWGRGGFPAPLNLMEGFWGGRRAPDPAHRAAATPLALAGEEEGAAVGLEGAVV